MTKKTVTYLDYNGEERTEDCYFNLTEAEIIEMETSVEGGLAEQIQKITDANNVDAAAIIKLFKELLLKSYGQKSDDGKRFIKSEEAATAFSQTPAYSKIFMELASDAEAAANFINGVIPQVAVANNVGATKFIPNK